MILKREVFFTEMFCQPGYGQQSATQSKIKRLNAVVCANIPSNELKIIIQK